eukprot:m.298879 g.298879  ORF g.298879 m.298879 type:complete len:1258 (-) comp13981_c0_seq1:238-4011(-)
MAKSSARQRRPAAGAAADAAAVPDGTERQAHRSLKSVQSLVAGPTRDTGYGMGILTIYALLIALFIHQACGMDSFLGVFAITLITMALDMMVLHFFFPSDFQFAWMMNVPKRHPTLSLFAAALSLFVIVLYISSVLLRIGSQYAEVKMGSVFFRALLFFIVVAPLEIWALYTRKPTALRPGEELHERILKVQRRQKHIDTDCSCVKNLLEQHPEVRDEIAKRNKLAEEDTPRVDRNGDGVIDDKDDIYDKEHRIQWVVVRNFVIIFFVITIGLNIPSLVFAGALCVTIVFGFEVLRAELLGTEKFERRSAYNLLHAIPFVIFVLLAILQLEHGVCTKLPGVSAAPSVSFPFDIERLSTQFHHGPSARLQHDRQVACLTASVEIMPALPPQIGIGLFSDRGRTYDAVVRLSGDNPSNVDSDPEPRGMSIKLFGVDGEKLLTDNSSRTCNENSQDFVLLSSTIFFIADTTYYASLVESLFTGGITGVVRWAFGLYSSAHPAPSFFRPLTWQPAVLLNVATMIWESRSMNNPLDWTYHSTTPYQLGKKAVKYSVSPCLHTFTEAQRQEYVELRAKYPADFLHRTVARRLDTGGDVCLELNVQVQQDPCRDDVDDPTRAWSAKSGFVKVAEIHIKSQDFLLRDQDQFCRNMSFNPWHARVEHKPLGQINEARKAYAIAAKYRNCTTPDVLPKFSGKPIPDTLGGAGDVDFYQYSNYPYPTNYLPRRLKQDLGLTGKETFSANKLLRMLGKFVGKITRERLIPSTDPLRNIEDFEKLLEHPDMQFEKVFHESAIFAHFELWKNDTWFTDQFLNGINPNMIRFADNDINKLPDDLRVSKVNEALRKHTGNPNASVAALVQEKRLLFAEYSFLTDLETNPLFFLYKPIAIFIKTPQSTLEIVAIQLTRAANPEDNAIFSRESPAHAWTFAKLHVLHSDANIHESVEHLAFTHLAMEPIVIAFHRVFPSDHPMLQFMVPHFRETIAISDLGRKTLLEPTKGSFQVITSLSYEGTLLSMQKGLTVAVPNNPKRAWSLHGNAPRARLEERGFSCKKDAELKGYYFRDDVCRIYDLLHMYVSEFVAKHICDTPDKNQCSKQIAADPLFQALSRELNDEYLANLPGGVPEFTNFDTLVETVTNIVHVATAQHSAVNFGQLQWYGFIPNRPLQLRNQMPLDLTRVDERYIALSLQTKRSLALEEITLLDLLSMQPKRTLDSWLRSTPFTSSKKLIEMMEQIESDIDERNKHLFQPYIWLKPSRIAASIAI